MTRRQTRTRATASLRFDQKLVLNQWLLSHFGRTDFRKLADVIKHSEEGLDEDNTHLFLYQLRTLPGLGTVRWEQLLQYDQNIVRHTRRIGERRAEPIQWKYFQWLTLLFTELYLHKYFEAPEQLLNELNDYVAEFNRDRPAGDQVPSYTADELTKVAFWNATGSGKTLLMHVNMLQYLHYLDRYGQPNELNRILLLTPNEGLSRQHLAEFHASGIPADLFDKDRGRLLAGHTVEILDIHKLREDMGEKTVAIDSFEGNNLVLVDEGHRGTRSEIGHWMQARDRLCENGFSFEYSATFGQAMRQSGPLHDRYAKCILFDYSYKHFYADGFGKDYHILNLADDSDEERRRLYLTACLVSFYQQQRLYRDKQREFRPFNLENPLLVFVGNTVNAVRTEKGRRVSDVVDVLLFLSEFVKNKRQTVTALKRLLGGNPGLTDKRGHELFATAFGYLRETGMSADEVYDDMLATLFNAKAPAALHVEELKGADGEIALRLGDNAEFGVINVGDASALRRLCEDQGEALVVGERAFSGSLFASLDRGDSTVNILIGSKKFTEGWNSWRVSTMGLMNVGKTAGPEIIQLFGRGVRLKGYEMSLKRSDELAVQRPKHIKLIETLNVFGVRSHYMEQFREYLAEEGVPDNDRPAHEVRVPAVKNLDETPLTVVAIQDGVNFKQNGPKPNLGEEFERIARYRIELNWYPMIQATRSKGAQATDDVAVFDECRFEAKHIAFMDMHAIWFELQQFKNENSWYNLNLPLDAIEAILLDPNWYVLKIPKEEMEVGSFARIRRWQDIAIALLRRYIDRFYKHKRAEYEKDFREYRTLQSDDGNFVDEYRFTVRDASGTFVTALEQLASALLDGTFAGDWEQGNVKALYFNQHLYQPLFSVDGNLVRVSPVSLNKGEYQFVADLRTFYERHPDFFQDTPMYLLRNMSRGRGYGFFEAGNFHPDFILWLLVDGKQYVTYVDPKGLRQIGGPNDPKVQFYRIVKEIERELGDPNITLNSFVVSPTPFEQIKLPWGMSQDALLDSHVLFQEQGPEIYIRAMFDRILSP